MNIGQGPELGDMLFTLPTIRTFTDPSVFALERPWCRPGFKARSTVLKRLLEAQPYIRSFKPHSDEPLDLDLSTYRGSGHRVGESIPSKIARWARVKIDMETPWLSAEPSPKTHGRIIVNRCPRWQSFGTFPWKQLVQTFQKEILFVGLEGEYRAFCTQFGMVEYLRTKDLLDVAEAIAGSECFIGNQSSCNAVCEGLKFPNILEVCSYACDCFTGRSTTEYCVTGELHVEICGKEFHYEPVPVRGMWQGECEGRPIYGPTEMECRLMVRAQHICQGLPIPLMDQIRVSPASP